MTEEVLKKLEAIESLLQRLPEIQAAVFLQMQDERDAARIQGKNVKDLWTIAPPHQR